MTIPNGISVARATKIIGRAHLTWINYEFPRETMMVTGYNTAQLFGRRGGAGS
jgi:hypothetical protein